MDMNALQAAFAANDNKNKPSRPSNYYPFWKMNDNEQAIVRFLPDVDAANPLGFLVEKLTHVLNINGERKTVPCLKMYDEECPICKVSQEFYKSGDEVKGKQYWRKKQHIGQVLVLEDPLPVDDETGENHEGKVRFLQIGFQLFNVVKEAFESGELDEVPFAFENGTNFIIKKSKQGDKANYTFGSKFARKSTDLTEDELAIVTDTSVELKTLLPAHPGIEKVQSMLEAALTGGEYSEDNDSGTLNFKSKSDVEESADSVASVVDTPQTNNDASHDDEYDEEADKILAQIRARRSE